MAERFWLSTGDIREQYDTITVVSARRDMLWPPGFAPSVPDHQTTYRQVLDDLTVAAREAGANGVIWIRFVVNEGFSPGSLHASGTAVRVNS
jgi:hypothetical protein